MKKMLLLLVFLFVIKADAQFYVHHDPFAHTYSVIARDPESGEIGGAVQSHWFNVGALVLWGEAGTGMIATQSFVNVSFCLRGLELLRAGLTPKQVVDSLINSDEGRDGRQLAVMDANGNTYSYTGKYCVEGAGDLHGQNYSVQANLMANNKIWPAMEKAFKETKAPLAEKLIAVLEAAQKEGGDIRGKQAAALIVYKEKSSGKPWDDKLIDLRVEDNPNPVEELSRLLKVHRAYDHMNNGDLATEKGDITTALKEYSTAEEMFPDNEEMKFWHAVMLFNSNKKEDSYKLFSKVFQMNANYRTLIPRLVNSKLLNANQEEIDKLTNLR
jgi:uncharacterized Ntn-hydrolase superfamily protein